jgi:Recombination endonuclease VII
MMTPEERRIAKRATEKAWRQRNPEKIREFERRARERDPERFRLKATRASRKFKGYPAPTRPCPDLCEACGRPPGARALHLDHDHETGAFRGWLCHGCNRGIGLLKDSIEGVEKALAYLVRVRGN